MSPKKIKSAAVIITVLVCNTLYAQDSLKSSFEVGLNLFNLTYVRIPTANESAGGLTPGYVSGIFFKLHYPAVALRVSADHFSYMNKTTAKNEDIADTISTSYRYKNTIVSAGFERTFFDKNFFQLYYGVDLSLFTGDYTSTNTSVTGLSSFSSEKQQAGFGLSPFVGLRFIVGKFLVLSYEPSFYGAFYKETENRIYIAPTAEEKTTTSFNFDGRPNIVNRLSISIRIPTQKQGKRD